MQKKQFMQIMQKHKMQKMQNISSQTVENVEIEVCLENVENGESVENVEYQFFIVENVECHDIIKNLFDSSIVNSDTIINKFNKN